MEYLIKRINHAQKPHFSRARLLVQPTENQKARTRDNNGKKKKNDDVVERHARF